jgi:hypothetical protein
MISDGVSVDIFTMISDGVSVQDETESGDNGHVSCH